jgi:hypothetical protein
LFLFPLSSAIKNPLQQVPGISDGRHSEREKLATLPSHEMNVRVNQARQNSAILLTAVCYCPRHEIAGYDIRDHAVFHKDSLVYNGALPVKYSGTRECDDTIGRGKVIHLRSRPVVTVEQVLDGKSAAYHAAALGKSSAPSRFPKKGSAHATERHSIVHMYTSFTRRPANQGSDLKSAVYLAASRTSCS